MTVWFALVLLFLNFIKGIECGRIQRLSSEEFIRDIGPCGTFDNPCNFPLEQEKDDHKPVSVSKLVSIRYPIERKIFRKIFFYSLELTPQGVILCGEFEFHISET
jgi:hypothetical protein